MNTLLKYTTTPFLDLSPLQVKFLLSVAEDYECICPAPGIYYDPVTYRPGFLIDRSHQVYGADFLIRHRQTREAILMEVLENVFDDDPRLLLHRQIAENYIQRKGYDWKYKCLFEDEILLTPNESILFDSYMQIGCEDDRREWLVDYLSFSFSLKPMAFQSADYSIMDFLIHGIFPSTL